MEGGCVEVRGCFWIEEVNIDSPPIVGKSGIAMLLNYGHDGGWQGRKVRGVAAEIGWTAGGVGKCDAGSPPADQCEVYIEF